VGLETALALVMTGLVEPGVITLERAVDLMTWAPSKILNLPTGRLYAGGPADIAVFDADARWTIDPEQFASKGRNTPFAGMTVRGHVRTTVCNGRVVYDA
jgi:dihydroorotase